MVATKLQVFYLFIKVKKSTFATGSPDLLMRNKLYINLFMILFSMVLIAMPAIPHHHHGNGIICMKDDLKETDCCATHHTHHHQENDPCCDEDCLVHFKTLPSVDFDDIQPQFTYIDILFTESILRFITQPLEKEVHKDYVFVESLHGTYITRAAGLRAPPRLG